jgi:hypothetical protein
LDNFDDRYLGAKTADPALDNDGNALVLGALYFNSTDGVMKVYTASGWIAASSASVATLATFEFVATSGQTVFTGNDANGSSLSYVAPAIIVTLNGVRLRPGDDYTATNGTSITLISAAALNDELVVDAFGSFLVANTYTIAQTDAGFVAVTGNQSIAGNKNFASNTLYVDDTNDRIGVGTNSPVFKTEIVGGTNTAETTLLLLRSEHTGTNTGTTIAFANSTNQTAGSGRVELAALRDTASGSSFVLRTADSGGTIQNRVRVDEAGLFQFNSGYGSVATAYGCRAWVNFNGTGTPAIRASGNVSSITDNSTGNYTVNFTTAMPDANYSAVGSVFDNGVACFASFTTSSVNVYTRLIQGASGPVDDYSIVSVSIFR